MSYHRAAVDLAYAARMSARALVLPLALAACGGQTPTPSPTSPPVAASELPAATRAAIDAAMAGHTGSDRPGCAVAVLRAGELRFARGYGMADLERGVAIAPDTVFDIGSTSKQFTAAVVVLLAQDGALSLDDDVRRWLPELPALGATPITLRHLLHHTSGIRDYTGLLAMRGAHDEDVTTAADAVAALARQRGLEFEPGTQHGYSNSGYFLLSQVVERATGRTLTKLAAERIFAPLGMTRTHVHDDHGLLVPGRAIGYAPGDHGDWRIAMSNWEQTGDGAVMTTVEDLARWDGNFYAAKVGGPALLDELSRRGVLADGTTLDYAAGLMHGSHRGQATVGHGGAWAGYRAELLRFPEQRTSIAVLCNTASAEPSFDALAIGDAVLGDVLDPEPAAAPGKAPPAGPELDDAALDVWVGAYWSQQAGGVVTVSRDAAGLVVDGAFHLIAEDARRFRVVERPGMFVTFPTDGQMHIEFVGGSFDLVRAAGTWTAAQRAAAAGRYRSDELDVTWTITVDGEQMRLAGSGPDEDLTPISADLLATAGGAFHVERDARGAVTGLRLDADRLRGITFTKQR